MKYDLLRKKTVMDEMNSSGEVFRLNFLKTVVLLLIAAFIIIAFKSEVPALTRFFGETVKNFDENFITASFS